ncbi:MAG: hypothetical protein ACFFB3_16165, partial [Candidatus Hodarchaeota archaeon]
MFNISYRKGIYWGMFLLLTLGLLLVPAIPMRASSAPLTAKSATIAPAIQSAELEPLTPDWYDEAGQIWINPEGWVDSEVQMQGSDIFVGDYDFNQLPESLKGILDHANFRFRKTGDPHEMNGNIHVNLRTENLTLAESYGQIILDLLNRYTIVTWEHRATWGWDEWRHPDWVHLTAVEYNAHINWPWFMGIINDAIPRSFGGLAETVDISDANELSFWAWPGHEGNEIWHGIGAHWWGEAPYLGGHFSFSATDLLHVDTLQASSHDDSLWISWYLPNVQNLASTPNYNSSANWYIYQNYHPDLEEPWNIHHHYDVWMDLYTSISDFQISFDYTFVPWELQNVEEFTALADPYGYLQKEASFCNHSLVDLSSIAGM